MNKKYLKLVGLSMFGIIVFALIFKSKYKHDEVANSLKNSQIVKAHDEDLHSEEEEHGKEGHEDEHGHEGEKHEEENSKIGNGKGIISASEDKGFELSREAMKNFSFTTIKLSGDFPWKLPISSLLLSQDEVNIYRIREKMIKRIDLEVIKKTEGFIWIKSFDLKNGDSVIISNIGFIRIAELVAFGGAEEGHSH